MSEVTEYVLNLSDEDLYKELKSLGYPIGPIVATTRHLYRRKLIQLLEYQDGQSNINPENNISLFTNSDDNKISHFTSSSPLMSHELGDMQNFVHTNSSLGNYEKDSLFSLSGSQNASCVSPSFSSKNSNPYESQKIQTGKDNSYVRKRNNPELSHYRMRYTSEDPRPEMARHIQEQSNMGMKMIIFGSLIMASFFLLYNVYNAWTENDPYREIEEAAENIIEESNI